MSLVISLGTNLLSSSEFGLNNLGVDDHEVYRVFNEMGIDLNFDDDVHDEL